MDRRRVSESVFGTQRKVDGGVDVTDSHHRHHGCHLLGPDQVVLLRDLGHDQAHVAVRLDSDLREDLGCVLADPLGAHHRRLVRRSGFLEDDPLEAFQLVFFQAVRPGGHHRLDEAVGDRIDHDRRLLVDADDVVVERSTPHDVTTGLSDVCRRVDDRGRIARSGGDGLLRHLEGFADHTGATRDEEDGDVGVGHQVFGALERRIRRRGDQVGRTTGRGDRPVEDLDVLDGHVLGPGVDVERDGVACRDHRDRVVDDRRRRVRRRCDGTDDPVGGELGDHHASVTGDDLGLEILGTGGFRRDEVVLERLVLGPSQTGLGPSEIAEPFAFAQHGFAHRLDEGAAPLEPHVAVPQERSPRRRNGIVDRWMDAVTELRLHRRELTDRAQRGSAPVTALRGGDATLDPVDDRRDLGVCQHPPLT